MTRWIAAITTMGFLTTVALAQTTQPPQPCVQQLATANEKLRALAQLEEHRDRQFHILRSDHTKWAWSAANRAQGHYDNGRTWYEMALENYAACLRHSLFKLMESKND